jgi:regulator of sigma E protease
VSALVIIVLLGLLILAHEAGHYVAARWAGIPVERFSIGVGPSLWSRTRAGTEFRVAAIPLGGYVLPAIEDEETWFRIPVRERIVFALGGPVANLLLPLPLLAARHVLQEGFSWGAIFVAPFVDVAGMLASVGAGLATLASQPDALSGVVGIVVEGNRLVGTDPMRALGFSSFLSVNLAIFNLLPIPALDGGKILLALVEKLHPSTRRIQVALTAVGWVMILGLLVYTLGLDLTRYLA